MNPSKVAGEEAHQREMSNSAWDEIKYKDARMDERIGILKDSLPNFLVEHGSLYSILSKGIHELSESECLGAFPTTKLGIELILDEKLEKIEREEKIRKASKSISDLTGKIKQ